MSTNKIIAQIEAEQMQKELPEFGPGDTLVVQVKVKEGNRERLQAFEHCARRFIQAWVGQRTKKAKV